jgi:hypothetical protein
MAMSIAGGYSRVLEVYRLAGVGCRLRLQTAVLYNYHTRLRPADNDPTGGDLDVWDTALSYFKLITEQLTDMVSIRRQCLIIDTGGCMVARY